MKKYPIQRFSRSLLIALSVIFMGVSAGAVSLNEIFKVSERLNTQAKQSQSKIDALTEETRKLLNEYKTELKVIEGLKVYNAQLERQIRNQEKELAQIAQSIDEVTVIQRQITPLMLRMIDGLEQFVELDLPFLMKERHDRVERLRDIMERADVSVSEKFNQVLRAFQIENDYGSTMEAYTQKIAIDGKERVVDILKVGRIALVYQSTDGEQTGAWNAATGAWETLSDEFTTPVKNGIRMARKQLAVNMLIIPVQAPEAAE